MTDFEVSERKTKGRISDGEGHGLGIAKDITCFMQRVQYV